MKIFIVLVISTFFVISCGSKKKSADADKMTDGKKMESSKDAEKEGDSAAAAGGGEKVSCSMKNDKRDIHVRQSGKGCELVYTKFGNEEVVATSMSGTSHCQKIADRIQGNLESAGFKCE